MQKLAEKMDTWWFKLHISDKVSCLVGVKLWIGGEAFWHCCWWPEEKNKGEFEMLKKTVMVVLQRTFFGEDESIFL